MPPLKDKVLSRMTTILARDAPSDLSRDALIAYIIAVVVFFIVGVALMRWIEKRDLRQ